MHDGKALTLQQVLLPKPLGYRHGNLQSSSATDVEDLVNFLNSLEPQQALQVQLLDTAIKLPQTNSPSIAIANVEFFYSTSKEEDRTVLDLGFRHGANVATDVYIVVEQLSNGQIWSLDRELNLLEMGVDSFAPTETFERPSEFRRINLPSTVVDQADLDAVYRIHAVAVRGGKTPFILNNWLSFDSRS